MTTPRSSTSDSGREFERYVGSLYEALGFRVEQNVPVHGQQVDLLIERSIAGLGLIRVVVECKFLTNGAISNQAVFDFVSFFRSARESAFLTGAVLVTNRDFSKTAKDAARSERLLELKRQADLEDELFDVSDALLQKIRSYKRTDLFRHYVPISGHGSFPGTQAADRIEDVLAAMEAWLVKRPQGLLTVLGDFGSGKTTLLTRLEFRMAQAHVIHAENAHIPVLFALKNRRYHDSLSDFIRETLLQQFDRKVPLQTFNQFLDTGRLLILLDGFDEISTKTNAEQRSEMFLDLSKLFNSRSPCILTCRPTFFVRQNEYNLMLSKLARNRNKSIGLNLIPVRIPERVLQKALDRTDTALQSPAISEIVLKAFSEDQVDQYLRGFDSDFRRCCGAGWLEVKLFLLRIYDLRDLMTRPILVAMIAETVIESDIDIRGNKVIAGSVGLYELYTGLQFSRDADKGEQRRFVTPEQRQLFAQATALAMLTGKRLSVDEGTIFATIEAAMAAEAATLAPLATLGREALATDVSTCTFLSRAADGGFQFVHKSFMEFFVAQAIKREIEREIGTGRRQIDQTTLSQPIPIEIIAFLAEYHLVDGEFPANISGLFTPAKLAAAADVLRSNMQTLILLIGDKIERREFVLHTMANLRIARKRWIGHSFRECTFLRLKLVDCYIQEARCTSLALDRVEWECSTISRTQGSWRALRSRFQKVDLRYCRMEWILDGANFNEVTIANSEIGLDGMGIFQSCQIDNSTMLISGYRPTITFNRSRVSRSNIICRWMTEAAAAARDPDPVEPKRRPPSSLDRIRIAMLDCAVEDSLLLGVSVDFADLESFIDLSRAHNVGGVVFTSERHEAGLLTRPNTTIDRVSDHLLIIRVGQDFDFRELHVLLLSVRPVLDLPLDQYRFFKQFIDDLSAHPT